MVHTVATNTEQLLNSVAPHLCFSRPWLLGTLVLTDASVPKVLRNPPKKYIYVLLST